MWSVPDLDAVNHNRRHVATSDLICVSRLMSERTTRVNTRATASCRNPAPGGVSITQALSRQGLDPRETYEVRRRGELNRRVMHRGGRDRDHNHRCCCCRCCEDCTGEGACFEGGRCRGLEIQKERRAQCSFCNLWEITRLSTCWIASGSDASQERKSKRFCDCDCERNFDLTHTVAPCPSCPSLLQAAS